MIGCGEHKIIAEMIEKLSKERCECEGYDYSMPTTQILSVPRIFVSKPKKFKMDKA